MRSKAGTFCMVLGAVLVTLALSLFLFNQQESREAEEAVREVLPKLMEELEDESREPEEELPDPYDPEMTVVQIDGYGYIGCLSIPSLNLELPVMSEWDYERLKTAPCRYSGSVKMDNLVIAGHNYATHFSPIKWLEAGNEVNFTDMDGKTWHYQVAWMEILEPQAVEKMTMPEAEEDWDMTLFTCTTAGTARCTVRCIRVEEE